MSKFVDMILDDPLGAAILLCAIILLTSCTLHEVATTWGLAR